MSPKIKPSSYAGLWLYNSQRHENTLPRAQGGRMRNPTYSIHFTVTGAPTVKKNNQRVAFNGNFPTKYNTATYKRWEQSARLELQSQAGPYKDMFPINRPVNLQCLFYMPTLRRVDLSALYEGIQDLLASKDKINKRGFIASRGLYILEDDNFKIVAGHDGSRVRIDRERPRMEIIITPMEEDDL